MRDAAQSSFSASQAQPAPTQPAPTQPPSAQLSIDFNPDNGRGDVVTRGMLNWPIGTVANTERQIDAVKIELFVESSGAKKLAFDWWKGGYDFGATRASDGVTTEEAGAPIRLRITGLAPGRHTLTTLHNRVGAMPSPEAIIVEVAGNSRSVVPSHRVKHDDDAATCHLPFEQVAGQSCEIVFRPSSADHRVIINALAIDVIDPALQVRRPLPADGDEHVAAYPSINWQPPRSMDDRQVAHYQMYFGTDREEVRTATPISRSTSDKRKPLPRRPWPVIH